MCVILCTCAYLVLECHKVNIVMCYKRQGVTLTLSKHCPVKLTKEMTRLLPTVYSPPTPLMTLSGFAPLDAMFRHAWWRNHNGEATSYGNIKWPQARLSSLSTTPDSGLPLSKLRLRYQEANSTWLSDRNWYSVGYSTFFRLFISGLERLLRTMQSVENMRHGYCWEF